MGRFVDSGEEFGSDDGGDEGVIDPDAGVIEAVEDGFDAIIEVWSMGMREAMGGGEGEVGTFGEFEEGEWALEDEGDGDGDVGGDGGRWQEGLSGEGDEVFEGGGFGGGEGARFTVDGGEARA
jgi:hypothetical protein